MVAIVEILGLDLSFLNNFLAGVSPNIYLQAFILLLSFIILAEIVTFVMENIFVKIAKKTATDLDDKLIKQTKNPISLLFIFIGIKLAVLHINVQDSLGVFLARVNSVLLIISVIYIIIAILKAMIDYWMESFAKKTKTKIDANLVLLFKRVLNVLFFISIVLVVLKVWRIEIGPLLAGLGIGGIAVAFAMQKSLSNVFGGISLVLDKSVSVGDKIILDQQRMGTILDIGIRSTQIQTYDNEIIIIPNGRLEEMEIQNAAKHGEHVRIFIPFSVSYGSDVKKVKNVVIKVLEKVDGVMADPVSFVRLLEMKESGLSFMAYCWISDFRKKADAIDQATTLIYESLNKNKIKIPYPQMDVHLMKR